MEHSVVINEMMFEIRKLALELAIRNWGGQAPRDVIKTAEAYAAFLAGKEKDATPT